MWSLDYDSFTLNQIQKKSSSLFFLLIFFDDKLKFWKTNLNYDNSITKNVT